MHSILALLIPAHVCLVSLEDYWTTDECRLEQQQRVAEENIKIR